MSTWQLLYSAHHTRNLLGAVHWSCFERPDSKPPASRRIVSYLVVSYHFTAGLWLVGINRPHHPTHTEGGFVLSYVSLLSFLISYHRSELPAQGQPPTIPGKQCMLTYWGLEEVPPGLEHITCITSHQVPRHFATVLLGGTPAHPNKSIRKEHQRIPSENWQTAEIKYIQSKATPLTTFWNFKDAAAPATTYRVPKRTPRGLFCGAFLQLWWSEDIVNRFTWNLSDCERHQPVDFGTKPNQQRNNWLR